MPRSVMPQPNPSQGRKTVSSTPFWRDERAVRILLQLLFLGVVAAVVGFLYANMLHGLGELGLTFGYGFMRQEAGFAISEGIRYQPSDSYARAFLVGVVNTVQISLIGIVLATVIGATVGVARLSSNWLVRNLAKTYVEIFRNVPLLLQLLFWYTAVILQLPAVGQSVELFGHVFLNQRGLYMPRAVPVASYGVWKWFFLIGLIAAAAVYAYRYRQLKREDRPGFPSFRAVPTLLIIAAAGWLFVPGHPFTLELPELNRFNFVGGFKLSPEFSGLLLGLSIYTGAFIAEVVRGGIQAVDKGQREAALAIGLKPLQVMRLVVLPQALRIIIPPITSQYLNLTKNSSLAVAIGFPELFNIGTTTMNQTGQTIPVFLIIMLSYLVMSLSTSAFMNWYNRRMRLVER